MEVLITLLNNTMQVGYASAQPASTMMPLSQPTVGSSSDDTQMMQAAQPVMKTQPVMKMAAQPASTMMQAEGAWAAQPTVGSSSDDIQMMQAAQPASTMMTAATATPVSHGHVMKMPPPKLKKPPRELPQQGYTMTAATPVLDGYASTQVTQLDQIHAEIQSVIQGLVSKISQISTKIDKNSKRLDTNTKKLDENIALMQNDDEDQGGGGRHRHRRRRYTLRMKKRVKSLRNRRA